MHAVTLQKPASVQHWLQLYRLYLAAFPVTERKPFSIIVKKHRKGSFDVWCIRQDDRFAGLAITVKSEDLVLIDYLAVEAGCREQGIGSAALTALRQQYPGKDVFLEIESVYEDAPDRAQRLRRKQFYLNCGMTPMKVMVNLFGVKMELLGFDCHVSYDRYHSFYLRNVGDWAAGHIFRELHPEETFSS